MMYCDILFALWSNHHQLAEFLYIRCDQKENKSEQALQIIGYVVTKFYPNKRSLHRPRQFVVSNATL
jgi:hypothetical protein